MLLCICDPYERNFGIIVLLRDQLRILIKNTTYDVVVHLIEKQLKFAKVKSVQAKLVRMQSSFQK